LLEKNSEVQNLTMETLGTRVSTAFGSIKPSNLRL